MYISHIFKDVYILEEISSKNPFQLFQIDESDFIQTQDSILGVKEIINTQAKKLGLEISFSNSILEKIIHTQIKTCNYLVVISGFIHNINNHKGIIL